LGVSWKALLNIVQQIHQRGYQLDHARYLKRKHIEHLVKHWLASGIRVGTIKNRMSHVRWLMTRLNKKGIVPSNDALNIPKRQYTTHQDKSRTLTLQDLSKIQDTGMRLSLEGQRLFGLRMEESLKIQPHVADGETYLQIRGSWAKGGRDRIIPILIAEQREWLNTCRSFVKNKKVSLIPADMTYKTYRKRFEKGCERGY